MERLLKKGFYYNLTSKLKEKPSIKHKKIVKINIKFIYLIISIKNKGDLTFYLV